MFLVGIFGIVLVGCPLTAVALLCLDWPKKIFVNLIVIAAQVPPIIILVTITHEVMTNPDMTDAYFSAHVTNLVLTGTIAVGILLAALYIRWPKATSEVVAAAGTALLAKQAIDHHNKIRDAERAKAVADELDTRKGHLK